MNKIVLSAQDLLEDSFRLGLRVLEDGFRWQGRHYRSLSRIAREITGARWSGPRFFGLRDKAGD